MFASVYRFDILNDGCFNSVNIHFKIYKDMITLLIVLICIIIFVIFVYVMDLDAKKSNDIFDKILKKDMLDSETYEFLISEEADMMRNYISSLCNTMGIILESDNEEDEICF